MVLKYISNSLKLWAKRNKIQLWYIQPGNPCNKNGYVERFNRTMRYVDSLDDIRLQSTRVVMGLQQH